MRTRTAALITIALALAAAGGAVAGEREDRAREAFADRDYARGVALFREVLTADPDGEAADYCGMMVVKGHALGGEHEAAARAGLAFLENEKRVGSRYREKVAFLTARSLLALDRGPEAGDTMAASLARLSGPELRTRIATYYLEAADQAFDGREPAGPFDKGVAPDYPRALRLYGLARSSGIPSEKKRDALLRYARAALKTKGYNLVLDVLQGRQLLRADGGEDPESHFLRGQALLALNRRQEGRDALARLVAKAPKSELAPRALFLLGDQASLERIVREYPTHELAPEAAYRRGSLLIADGDVDGAVLAFLRAEQDFPESPFAPKAALAAAEALRGARRYDEAKARYDDFLRRYPESQSWAKARQGMTEAWFAQGSQALEAEKVDEAAKIWAGLRAKYPLSEYAPRSLYREAQARRGGQSLGLLKELLARYPKAPEAAPGALLVAQALQTLPGRIGDAVAAFERVAADYAGTAEASAASGRLLELQAESLSVTLPGPVRAKARPTLSVSTRNLRELDGRIYRIDPVEYFRKHGDLARMDRVMVDVLAPDATFGHQVLEFEKYRDIEGSLYVPVEGEGVYIVAVEGGKLKATGLMLVSGLTVVTKESPRGILAFVQDIDGDAVADATVLVRDATGKVRESSTGRDGVARIEFENDGGCGVLAVRGDSVAYDGYATMVRELRGLETKVHAATDRPVYRPGDEVGYRVVVRREAGEFRENPAGEPVLVTVSDRAGNVLHRLDARLGEFGTAHGAFALPADIPPATYSIVTRFDDGEYSSGFEVEAYRKPQVFFELSPVRPDYVRGETVEIEFAARYSFGRPVPGMRARVTAGRHVDTVVTTDENGHARIAVPTVPGDDMTLEVRAETRDATGRGYVASRSIVVPATAYRAIVSLSRQQAFVGEEIRAIVLTTDVLGEPVAAQGKIEIGRGSGGAFSLIESRAMKTAKEDGRAEIVVKVESAGTHRITWRGTDRAGREVTASAEVAVRSAGDRLTVRAEKSEAYVGETVKLTVAAPAGGLLALVTREGETVYDYEVVRLGDERNTLDLVAGVRHVPEVWIGVALISDGKLYTGLDRIAVREEIRLEVSPEKEEYAPGEVCRLKVRSVDPAGKPIPAEIALAVVDEAIYALHADTVDHLAKAFRPPSRGHLVRTGSSLDFTYRGKTDALSPDLLAERDRRNAPPPPRTVLLEKESLDDMPLEDDRNEDVIGIGGGAGGRFGGRAGKRNLVARGGGANMEESLFPARSDFRDTACFMANVVTGPDGEAVVEFQLPDDLTEWRVTARGVSHGNAFGEARGKVLTTRPLVVRAGLPRYLREGDRLTAAAGVVNGLEEAAKVTVQMAPVAGAEKASVDLEIAPGEEKTADWPLAAGAPGVTEMNVRATASGLAEDAVTKMLRTLPYGVPYRTGFSGVTSDPGEERLTLPEDHVPGTVKMTLHIAPTLTRAALEGCGVLTEFPYGCVEQTVNRFYPALEVAAAVRALGLDRSELLPELDRIARAGALRLTYLQNSEGLWGWWGKGASNPEMTAYALIGLARAKQAGIGFSDKTLPRASEALPRLLTRVSEPDEKAFLTFAGALAFGADFQSLASSFADRGRLGIRGLAFLALAYEPLGTTTQAEILVGEIGNRIRAGARVETEDLGWALAAAAGMDPASDLARQLGADLAQRRDGRAFGTTRETGAAVVGLARAARGQGATGAGAIVFVNLNGQSALKAAIRPGDTSSARLDIPADALVTGANRFSVVTSGGGVLPYSVVLECVRRQAPPPTGSLRLSRTYSLVPGAPLDVRPERDPLLRPGGRAREPRVELVRMGETVRVTLTVSGAGERYLVVEDPIPAGFEPLAGTEKGPFAEATRHDDRMVFFLENPQEESVITYLVQGESRGAMRSPPGVTYAMYHPRSAAWSDEATLRVAPIDGEIDRDPTVGLAALDLWESAQKANSERKFKTASSLLNALLDRYDLTDRALAAALTALAKAAFELGDHASTLQSYERLLAEVPGSPLTMEDERIRAESFRRLGRHGEAIASLERVARFLFLIDIEVPRAIGGQGAGNLTREILDRYPDGPYSETAWSGIALAGAGAFEDLLGKGKPANADLLEPIGEFLARFPESASAPTLAYRYAKAWLKAGDYVTLEKAARRFGDRYPSHHLGDDADWLVAFALFATDRLDEAEAFSRVALEKTYTNSDGTKGPGAYGKNLTHLLAQVAHIRGRLDEATALYREVAEFSSDAAEALKLLTGERLSLPEVMRYCIGDPVSLPVTVKNVGEVRLDLYPIDLLVYFSLQKDVERIAELNLDGLPAKKSLVLEFGAASLHREATRNGKLDVDSAGPGVYLVIARAGDKERRSVLLISDLEARVWPVNDSDARVLVTDSKSGEPVAGAFVKVARGGTLIGEGLTDARGMIEVRGSESVGPGGFSAVAVKAGSYALATESGSR